MLTGFPAGAGQPACHPGVRRFVLHADQRSVGDSPHWERAACVQVRSTPVCSQRRKHLAGQTQVNGCNANGAAAAVPSPGRLDWWHLVVCPAREACARSDPSARLGERKESGARYRITRESPFEAGTRFEPDEAARLTGNVKRRSSGQGRGASGRDRHIAPPVKPKHRPPRAADRADTHPQR